jgi:hypothetical protein
MLKYKIVIKPVNLSDATIENNFSVTDGYLVYDNSKVEQGVLVDEFNVQQFLEDPNNSVVVEKFKNYLREYTNELEFNEIFYKPKKVAPILNDFYNEEIRFNSEANPALITDAIKDTEVIYYQNNNYDFLSNQRMSFENKSLLFESLSADTEYKDYYIDFKIDLNKNFIANNDYSNYIKDYKDGDIIYKNSFVNLNNKVNPFEFWTNEKSTKKWITNPDNTKEIRVQDFENIALNFEQQAKAVKDKNSIEFAILNNKAIQARKVADLERAKLNRKTN